MSSVVILPWLKVENANAAAGLTWGFPAISHFLGYMHALSRKLQQSHGLTFEGCAVICHHHQVHAHTSGRDYQFSLTRNPLTREGKTASFNEEARMHMTVSLLLECKGEIAQGDAGMKALATHLQPLCQTQKLAGGTITSLRQVRVAAMPADDAAWRALKWPLMPGFALLDRSLWLTEHFNQQRQRNPHAELIDAWLDYATINIVAESENISSGKAAWHTAAKPQAGYLVPIMTGYQRISPLYAAGEVANSRDTETPFAFTEAVYGLGEWRGLHRITDINALFWRFHTTETGYYCRGLSVADAFEEAGDLSYYDDDI
nr:type I-F CRISPR-associated protein Csy2 [Pantoea sp. 201603H]